MTLRTAATPAAILGATVADAWLGDPARLHPVSGFGALAERLESLLWRPHRAAGALYALLLVSAPTAAAAVLHRRYAGRPLARTGFTAAVTWATLGGRSLAREAHGLARAVERGDLEDARRRAPALVGRDPAELDGSELCRAAIESVAENTVDAVVAPLVWCAVAGAPGAAGYRAANTLDALVGHRTPRYERFGWASARLDDLLTWPGARVGAALTVVSSPFVGGEARRAWRVLRRDGRRHPSPNAGLLEAAFAGALGVRLGGANRYGERVEERPFLGDGVAPGVADVYRAVRLSRLVSWAATMVAIALARAVRA